VNNNFNYFEKVVNAIKAKKYQEEKISDFNDISEPPKLHEKEHLDSFLNENRVFLNKRNISELISRLKRKFDLTNKSQVINNHLLSLTQITSQLLENSGNTIGTFPLKFQGTSLIKYSNNLCVYLIFYRFGARKTKL
jgi:hypothetical protein